jgi:hypothetical protein
VKWHTNSSLTAYKMTRYELSEEANQAINDWISQIIDSTTTPTNNKLSDCTRGTRDNQRSDVSIPILSYRPQQLAILEREVSGERVLRKESLEELENEALDDGEEEPATFAVKKKGRKSKGKKAKGTDRAKLYDPSSFKYDDISAQFEKMNEAIDKEQREAERILNAPRA